MKLTLHIEIDTDERWDSPSYLIETLRYAFEDTLSGDGIKIGGIKYDYRLQQTDSKSLPEISEQTERESRERSKF
jgi:hypothetical protein|tara:strand:+ start:416 stop:640 length:225 start_codon:yes stop_codon:yes gene_type:complete